MTQTSALLRILIIVFAVFYAACALWKMLVKPAISATLEFLASKLVVVSILISFFNWCYFLVGVVVTISLCAGMVYTVYIECVRQIWLLPGSDWGRLMVSSAQVYTWIRSFLVPQEIEEPVSVGDNVCESTQSPSGSRYQRDCENSYKAPLATFSFVKKEKRQTPIPRESCVADELVERIRSKRIEELRRMQRGPLGNPIPSGPKRRSGRVVQLNAMKPKAEAIRVWDRRHPVNGGIPLAVAVPTQPNQFLRAYNPADYAEEHVVVPQLIVTPPTPSKLGHSALMGMGNAPSWASMPQAAACSENVVQIDSSSQPRQESNVFMPMNPIPGPLASMAPAAGTPMLGNYVVQAKVVAPSAPSVLNTAVVAPPMLGNYAVGPKVEEAAPKLGSYSVGGKAPAAPQSNILGSGSDDSNALARKQAKIAAASRASTKAGGYTSGYSSSRTTRPKIRLD